MKHIYLALAVLGAVVPYLFFVEHFASAGLNPLVFVASGFANPGAAGSAILIMTSGRRVDDGSDENGSRTAGQIAADPVQQHRA